MEANTTLLEKVVEYFNLLTAREADIAALTNTIANLQGNMSNLKGNSQVSPNKTPQQPAVKKL